MCAARIKAVLIDLSGTLHIDDELIAGSAQALEKLRAHEANLRIRFVTNTTKDSKANLHALLTRLGLRIQLDEIFTSLSAARHLLEARSLRPLLLVESSALSDFDGLDTNNPNAVVIGLAPKRFNYDDLNEAFRLIVNNDAALIGIHKARYYQRKDGLALGPGAFIAGLEYSTGKRADIVGKPSDDFFLASISAWSDHVQPSECVMIGDDALDDVDGAQRAGMRGILVRTGKYRSGDESRLPESRPPPLHVADTFAHAVNFILSQL